VIFGPSTSTVSTGLGAVFLTLAETCTRSARPTWSDLARRWARPIGLGGTMLGAPLDPCPPTRPERIVMSPHVEVCRPDYRASGRRRDYQDDTLRRALTWPSLATTPPGTTLTPSPVVARWVVPAPTLVQTR
jgi:hypothetical protein